MGIVDIVLVRHGESLGNVAREGAEADGIDRIPLEWRDADTPLSELGRAQAAAAAVAVAALDPRPAEVWTSPYVRAAGTAAAIGDALGLPPVIDERLRDRELGVLDGLTSHGVRRLFADETTRRRSLGKFYYRPPGGESWADVALRVRSFLADPVPGNEPGGDRRIVLVTHDAVVLLVRYVLEGLSEAALLDVAFAGSVPNASITRVTRTDGRWQTTMFGTVDHLKAQGVEASLHGSEPEPHER
jgi:broad specificity phosphatase PhoE